MKKRLLILMMFLVAIATGSWAEVEPYAALSDGNKTLTFYYDGQKSSRGGMSVGPFTDYSSRGWHNQRKTITTVVFDASFANYKPTSTAYWFYFFTNLTTITGIENLKTDDVTDMRYMFYDCTSLTSLDLSGFNTENVTNMSIMFSLCTSLTSLDVSSFNTANVEYMNGMFWGCSSLTSLDVSRFNTANVTKMSDMFSGCSSLTSLDVSKFNTEKVQSMGSMFLGCSSLTSLDVSTFDTGSLTYVKSMFQDCSSLTNIILTGFNTKHVESLAGMFAGCSSLTNLDITSISNAAAWNIQYMFSGCTKLKTIYVDENIWTGDRGYDDATNMFAGCEALVGGNGTPYDANHTGHEYARIDRKGKPGYFSKKFTEPEAYAALSDDNKTLTFYYDMEEPSRGGMSVGPFTDDDERGWDDYCSSITTVVFDASFADYRPTSTAYWFGNLVNLTTITGIENLKTDEVTNMRGMFWGCSSLTSLDVSSFKTANVTSMNYMFYYCSSLTSLDLSSFNTANVEYMNGMFSWCSSLTSLDLSSFNTANVTSMGYMFYNCSNLTSLDLSSFKTVKLSDTGNMFYGCSALTKITVDPDKWDISKATYSYDMFYNCTSLVGGNGTAYDENHRDATYAVIDKPGTPGYLTDASAHTHTAGSPVQENMVGPSCTTDGQYDVVEYCTICGEEMSRETQYIPALGHDLTHVPEVPATTTAEGMKEHYTCKRCTDLLDKNYATVTASDLVIPKLVEPEAYAALSNDNKTLTFYYDGQKASRNGMSVGPFTSSSNRGWNNLSEEITTVVFDASFADYKPTSTAYWFYNFNYLTTITGIENLKTDEVTNMESMFYECRSLTNLDLSGFNTEKVTNMGYMFGGCYSLTNLDLSSFNTANVEYMGFMFGNCYSLTSLDLSSFNTANVTNMAAMFRGCSGLTSLDLSIFNTANVKFTYEMFYGCSSLTSLDLSSFNTANVTGMGYMFNNCSSLTSLDLSSFNTENVTSMSYMFCGCTALTKIAVDPDKWDTSKVTYSEEMFKGCTNLVGGNGTVYDENHTDVAYAVVDKDGTPGYLTDVNTPTEPEAYAVLSGDGKTLTFYYDMEKASRGGMSVGPFDGSTTLPAWSDKAGSIRNANIDESFAGYSELTSTAYWFEGCSELKAVSGLENLVMDNVTDMSNMFKGCNNLRSVSLSGMNTGKVTNMHGLFWDCNALQSIDLSTLDTRSVTDMSGMFNYCSGLKTVDLSGVNTASVTDMNNMFYYCSSLTDLDLSSFNTGSVTNMRYMFEGCSSLTKITVSETGWTTNAVTSATAMFRGCRDIVGGNGTTYDAGHTDEGYARIDKAGTPGYLTSSAGTGINLLKTTTGGDGYFYTPDGRRIEGQPTKQGFYITNGRKVMAK